MCRISGAALGIDEAGNELIGMGLAGRGFDFGLRGIGPAVAHVVEHRAVEQRGILGDHADCGAQRILGHAGDVLAIDDDAIPTARS